MATIQGPTKGSNLALEEIAVELVSFLSRFKLKMFWVAGRGVEKFAINLGTSILATSISAPRKTIRMIKTACLLFDILFTGFGCTRVVHSA
ncbi:MAG: hypothetical protein N2442_06115 [Spirochaetes bacterium]|nr:hypothetical protein [Spirochaetota bacterium]